MKYLFFFVTVFFYFNLQAQNQVTTVAHVDLQQYLGKWYKIAAIPQFFENQCSSNTTAEYATAENNLIAVTNSCEESSGEVSTANGRAEIVDTNSNAKLKVTFVNLFGWHFALGGDYWILDLGPNYSYAVVGSPDRNYAWILSRTPALPVDSLAQAGSVLKNQGFDTCKLISTKQNNGLQENSPLCKLTGTAP